MGFFLSQVFIKANKTISSVTCMTPLEKHCSKTESMAKQKLTTQSYWEIYYKTKHTDKAHIINVCSYYKPFWDKLIKYKNENRTLIEIGGYPGRYLAYLASEYKILPTCLDYNSNTSQIEESFDTMGVENFEIIQADFTDYEPKELYDYVISNGFVEHFKNYDEILDLHCKYLKKGGRMLIMIPNMRGYVKWYKYLVDYKNLKMHNLNVMCPEVFQSFSKRHNLSIKHLSYFGGFPFNVHQKLSLLQKVIYKFHRLLFKYVLNPFLEKHPSSYFSSGLILIAENKG